MGFMDVPRLDDNLLATAVAGANTAAALNATYAAKSALPDTKASGFLAKLGTYAPQSTTLLIGDSTGNGGNGNGDPEWYSLTASALASAYPRSTCKYHLWQDGPQTWGINTTLQSGALSESLTETFTRSGELVGSLPDVGGAPWGGTTGQWSLDGTAATWVAGSNPQIVESGTSGDFLATWVYSLITANGSAGKYTRFIAPSNLVGGLLLYVQLDITGTACTLRLMKKTDAGAAVQVAAGGVAVGDLNPNLATEQTITIKLSRTGTLLTVNAGTTTGAITWTLTTAEVTALANCSQFGFQGGITGSKIQSMTVTSRNVEPIVDFYNASEPGADISYFTDAVLATMTPPVPVDVLFFSLGHNGGLTAAATWVANYEAFIDHVRGMFPGAGVVVASQNPEKAPRDITLITAQNDKMVAIRAMCARRGFGYIPAMETIKAAPRPYNNLQADGIHPTTTGTDNGSQLWANAALAELKREGAYNLP
jgi:hypothetical protein